MTHVPLQTVADGQCYKDRWNPSEARCPERARWASRGTGGLTDGWLWCDEHRPTADPSYIEPVAARELRS